MPNHSLPVWQLQPQIVKTLTLGNQLVLIAATGSGKTTQVPQMLLDAGIAGNKRIVIMQPRRVAARTVASRVASERGCRIGGEVGYQVRFEEQLSEASRLCFVTEGIFLRWLQNNGELHGVGVVVFDEFHERNLLSDVALALVKRLQRSSRPDLKIIVMSATLDAQPVARFLTSNSEAPAPILVSDGRAFPVSIRWAEHTDQRPAAERAAEAVERIVHGGDRGDVLVFMPGVAEIQSTLNALRAIRFGDDCLLLALHGNLSPEEQDRPFAKTNRRKIIVSTNVAETSVTIDGVCHVVDAGLARIARYDAERGVQTLACEEISRASADQRAGRAGRTAPGTCWRLWTEGNHLLREDKNTPEIQRADLAETILLLHSLGVRQAAGFDWLDRPEPESVERAEALLALLGALSDGMLTPVGRTMLRLPMHPRYARMLVEAARLGCVPTAAHCAALVSGRDLLLRQSREQNQGPPSRERFEEDTESDFHTLLRAQEFARDCHFDLHTCQRAGIHAQTARQIDETFRQLLQIAAKEQLFDGKEVAAHKQTCGQTGSESLAKCVLAGFIDQLAVRTAEGSLSCVLSEGRTGALVRESVVEAPLLVISSIREVDARGGRTLLLSLATAVRQEWISEIFPQHLSTTVDHVFDRTHKRVAAVLQERCLGLLISEKQQRVIDGDASGRTLAEAFSKGCFDLPNLGHEQKQFISRVNLLCAALPELDFPAFDTAALEAALTPAFKGITLLREAREVDLRKHFKRHLAPEQLEWLDELLPLSIQWLGGRTLKLSYPETAPNAEPAWPEAQVKLSECWALKQQPTLGEGKVPVRLCLMLPDGKRLDDTTDFPAWRETHYPKKRAAIRAKYSGLLWP
jgi:ATP-dependent helicase HrpB